MRESSKVVYIREENPLLREMLFATGKFIVDPNPDSDFIFTIAREAYNYHYSVYFSAIDSDVQYYWEQMKKKRFV